MPRGKEELVPDPSFLVELNSKYHKQSNLLRQRSLLLL